MGGGFMEHSFSSSFESTASSDSPSVHNFSGNLSDLECEEAIREVYNGMVKQYEELQSQFDRLESGISEVLRYIPSSLIQKNDRFQLSQDQLPETTSIILVGPKGSGKSNLVNKISAVLEDNALGYGPAQVSYNSSPGDGTYFLHEYKVPRNSKSFCLFDTPSLSHDSLENKKMLYKWMNIGVCHCAKLKRDSDSAEAMRQLSVKARKRSCAKLKEVKFVIFVVNAVDVLKAMLDNEDSRKIYNEVLTSAFDNPFLSFKDNKPAVVITHGDLLSITDRTKIRIYLGELLWVHPARQIFDIPEGDEPGTMLTTMDMLSYCLKRADRNLPCKSVNSEVCFSLGVFCCILIALALVTVIISCIFSSMQKLLLVCSKIFYY